MEFIFIILSWLILLVPGFDDSVPPTGDKIFKIETSPDIVESIKVQSDGSFDLWGFDIILKQNSTGMLEVKIPKNLPTPASNIGFWAYDSRAHVLVNGADINYDIVEDPCYSHYKIPIDGKTNLEIVYTVILTGSWQLYTPVQFDEDNPCYNEVFYEKQHDSPLKQFRAGFAWYNIKCNDNNVIVLKTNNNPACVNFDSAIKLYKRGWATNMDNDVWYTWASKIVRGYFDSKIVPKYNVEENSVTIGITASRESLPPLLTVAVQFSSIDIHGKKQDHLLWFGVEGGDNISKILEIGKDGQQKEMKIER